MIQNPKKIRLVNIKIKQIQLNVKFACRLKTLFRFQNKPYLIDQSTQLIQGKASCFPLFSFDVDKQMQHSEILPSSFIEVYLQLNHGKLKILTREINFNQLKAGQTNFEHKFDNCPDKNASISYSITLQFESNEESIKKNLERLPMSESHFISWDKHIQNQARINPIKTNSYAKNYLITDQRLNKFIQTLQKKSVKSFSREPKSQSKSKAKATQSQVISKVNYNLQKETMLNEAQSGEKRRNSYSDIQEAKTKNNLNGKQSKDTQRNSIQTSRRIELNGILKLKDQKISKNYQETIKDLNQKLRHFQVESKKINHQNLVLKSKVQRLEDKVNAHKEKYESMKLSNEYSSNRFTTKETEYQEQIKNLSQKSVRCEYEKQKKEFENENLKNEIQKNEKTHLQAINHLNLTQSEELNELYKNIASYEQQLKETISQNLKIRQSALALQLKQTQSQEKIQNKYNQNEKLSDEILKLKMSIEKANSKIIFYEQTLQSHEIIDCELSLMKGDFSAKESHIDLLMAQIAKLKADLYLSEQKITKERDLKEKIQMQLNQFQKHNIQLEKTIQNLNLEIQSLQIESKIRQNADENLNKKCEKAQQHIKLIQNELKEVKLKFQKEIQAKNIQSLGLYAKRDSLYSQISEKTLQINDLLSKMNQKQESIDQAIQILQKYEQKLFSSHKINKWIEVNKISTPELSTESSKFQNSQVSMPIYQNSGKMEMKRDLAHYLRRIYASILQKAETLATKLQDTTEEKISMQRLINSLSRSLQKMHQQTLEQYSELKGTQLSLEEKLLINERLMTKMKLMVNEKSEQIKYVNEQLVISAQKVSKLKYENELLSREINSIKQTLNDSDEQVKKLQQTISSKDIVRKEVQAKLISKLKYLQAEYEHYKLKQLEMSKISQIQIQELTKNLHKTTLDLEVLQQSNLHLKQALVTNKLQVQRVSTLFVDIYKQINNLEKQGSVSSFLFIPLREAVKKVQAQVSPKPSSLTSSGRLDKQKLNSLRATHPGNALKTTSNGLKTTTTAKSPQIPQPPVLNKSPESKLSTTSKNSMERKERLKSKQKESV